MSLEAQFKNNDCERNIYSIQKDVKIGNLVELWHYTGDSVKDDSNPDKTCGYIHQISAAAIQIGVANPSNSKLELGEDCRELIPLDSIRYYRVID